MKPIATIHWLERGQVQKHECFDWPEIDRKRRELDKRGKFTWTCMENLPPGLLQRMREGVETKHPS